MSIILFHPRVSFDFQKKSPLKRKPHKIINAGIITAVGFLLLFVSLYQLASSGSDHSHISLKQYNIDLHPPKTFSRASVANTESLPSDPIANFAAEVPILMYHYTPENFEMQLQHLQSRGYTTITMSQLGRFLYSGEALPLKPVVITFDDGFYDQLKSFAILQKYQMRATYYIILGGEASNHCIGLTRTNLSCGDNYLNWTELKTISDSGLIEIGAHTLNHPDLPILSSPEQWQEIVESKKRLEDMYNISVTSFAYPYGHYNESTINLVKQAGYLTAVTTQSATNQSSENRYTMPRVRDALLLP